MSTRAPSQPRTSRVLSVMPPGPDRPAQASPRALRGYEAGLTEASLTQSGGWQQNGRPQLNWVHALRKRVGLVSPDRSTDRNQPIARSDRNRSQKPIASTDRSVWTQTSCNLTQPIAVFRSHRSHRSQSDRAIRGPIAVPKNPIAADRKEFTCLKSCIVHHLSFGTITNP